MNRRGVPILAALIGMVGILCLAVLVIDNVKRDQVTEQRLVDRAVEVARDEVDSATEQGGTIDAAVDERVEALGITTTTTIYGPYAFPTTTALTTTTTTTSTTQPLLPAVTTTTVTIPITLPTVPITLPEPLP